MSKLYPHQHLPPEFIYDDTQPINQRLRALQEVLWRIPVQHGPMAEAVQLLSEVIQERNAVTEELVMVRQIALNTHDQDAKLRANGARTLRRIADKIETILKQMGTVHG